MDTQIDEKQNKAHEEGNTDHTTVVSTPKMNSLKRKRDSGLDYSLKNHPKPSNEGDDKNRHDRALQYLRLWQSSRKAWKFNKMMQVHLLHVMYDASMMMDADFQIMLLYLDGLKGKGREKTMEDARKILDNVDTEGSAGKEDRARQLYQMLA